MTIHTYIAAGLALLAVGASAGEAVAQNTVECKPMAIDAISGTVGGVWFVGLGAVAKGLSADYEGSIINLLAGGSSGNPIRIDKGEGQLSITQHTMAVAGAKGSEPYSKPLSNVRSLLNIGDVSRLNIVVRADLPIQTIEDIKAQKAKLRFAPGPRGTVSELFGRWAFAEYGITFADLEEWGGSLYYGSYNEVADQMRDGRIDAFFWTGPGQAAFIQDVSSAVKLRWLPLSPAVLTTLGEKYGLGTGTLPADYYSSAVGADIPSAIDATELIVPVGMEDDTAYCLVKSILHNRDQIAAAYNAWNTISPEMAAKNLGFELHPGALNYYREHNLLP